MTKIDKFGRNYPLFTQIFDRCLFLIHFWSKKVVKKNFIFDHFWKKLKFVKNEFWGVHPPRTGRNFRDGHPDEKLKNGVFNHLKSRYLGEKTWFWGSKIIWKKVKKSYVFTTFLYGPPGGGRGRAVFPSKFFRASSKFTSINWSCFKMLIFENDIFLTKS